MQDGNVAAPNAAIAVTNVAKFSHLSDFGLLGADGIGPVASIYLLLLYYYCLGSMVTFNYLPSFHTFMGFCIA